jgi:hypothetical protein
MISGPGPTNPPSDAPPPPPISLIEALIPIVSLIVLIGMGYYLFGADGASGPNLFTADQYIAVVLPARMFKSGFRARGFAPVVLSRAVGDTGTVTGALIPWNSCGAYMAATLGVATFRYLPFTFFNLLSVVIALVMGFAGVRMLRLEEERVAPAPASSVSG